MTSASMDEIVHLDFEFISLRGETPRPICMVALEQNSGRMFRLWLEKEKPAAPLFAVGPRVLAVAYYASAELGCYLSLRCSFPQLVLDLYAGFRVATNGLTLPHGRGLLGAMQWYGLDAIEAARKDYVRKRILDGGPYSAAAIQANISLKDLKTRKEAALCEKADLENAVRRGDLLLVNDVYSFAARCFAGFRDSLLAISGELRDRLAMEDNPAVIGAILDDHHRQALRHIVRLMEEWAPAVTKDAAA
jgi:hypothetical protein